MALLPSALTWRSLPLCLALCGPLWAQRPVPDTLRWSELRAGIEAHPALEAARAQVREARAARREAAGIPNPGLEVRTLSVEASGDPSREELALSLPVDWLWTRPGRLQSARAGEAAALAAVSQLRRELTLAAGERYWSLARDQALAEAARELEEHARTLHRAVQARVRAGETRPAEEARAEVEALQAGLETAAAERELALDRERLAPWLPAGDGRSLTAVAEPWSLPVPPDSSRCAAALEEHPRLAAARQQVEGRRGALAAERWGRLPRLELQGILERADDRLARGAGLSLDLPLFNQGGSRVAQARAALEAAEAELAAERRRLGEELAAALSAGASSREAALAYQERILPRAAAAAEALERGWLAGEASLFELIDARRTLAQTRRQGIQVFSQAQLDALALETLLMKEND